MIQKALATEPHIQQDSLISGLTQQEVEQRRRDGLGNGTAHAPSRSYLHIVRKNVFTFVNMVLLTIGVLLAALGGFSDAITTAGLVTMNILIGMVQEIRAKRKLDQIVLLTRPRVTVIREGQEHQVDASEIVLGDVILVNPGDQIVCDGRVLAAPGGANRIEVDESLLTGESDYIPKEADDMVYSGSFVISGSTYYETTKVGKDSLANQITAKARKFEISITPLQHNVNRIVRMVSITTVVLGMVIFARAIYIHMPFIERVQMAAVIMGTIPQGLIFLTTLAYAVGAVRLAGQGVLVQQINAVESLSNTTMLCMDKTGTLTTNRIQYEDVAAHEISLEAFKQQLGDFVASATKNNRTGDAIMAALPGQKRPIVEEVPFASARKWSGMCFDTGDMKGAYVLGAPEVIMPDMQALAPTLAEQMSAWSDQGLRVILFAYSEQVASLFDEDDRPCLPDALTPLGLIALSDELRPEAHQTLEGFKQAGIDLKIISGDNPRTVTALATQVGFDNALAITGSDLDKLDEAGFARAVKENTIFGRITPDQKERLIEAMRNDGAYVAMVGDGVNDVLALKKAHIGIAMYSGSAAARNVSDIVLLNDSFAALPSVFQEGQRIVNGILDTMRLLLSRTVYVVSLIAFTALSDVPFPFLPTQDALNSFLTAGLPPMLLTLWAVKGRSPGQPLKAVGRFVFPAALTIAVLGAAVFVYFFAASDQGTEIARSALSTTVIGCGSMLILFAKPPAPFWAVIRPLSGDRRPVALAGVVLGLLAVALVTPPLRQFFRLTPLDLADYALIAGLVLIWTLAVRLAYQFVARDEDL